MLESRAPHQTRNDACATWTSIDGGSRWCDDTEQMFDYRDGQVDTVTPMNGRVSTGTLEPGTVLSPRGPTVLPIFFFPSLQRRTPRANRAGVPAFVPTERRGDLDLPLRGARCRGCSGRRAGPPRGAETSRLDVTDRDDLREWTHALEIAGIPSAEVEALPSSCPARPWSCESSPGWKSAMVLDWCRGPDHR